MLRFTSRAAALAAAGILSACSAGATGGPPIAAVNPTSPSYAALQFAVGTANLYGSAAPALNVVSTFRQSGGASATGVNAPKLTGPFSFTAIPFSSNQGLADPYMTAIDGGPSLTEWLAKTGIGGTPQTVAPGTPPCDLAPPLPPTTNPMVACQGNIPPNTTTFGQSGGVFALGIAPYNAVAATGQAYSYQPFAQPFYGAQDAISQYTFVPWGGPPAFDPDGTGMGERDGAGSINGVDSFGDPYFLGVAEGLTVFDGLSITSGTYGLTVAISTVGNGGAVSTQTLNASARLNSLAMLPAIAAPALTPDANGDGGATFTASLPAGVTEGYVQIVDFGPNGGPKNGAASSPLNCQGARGTHFAPVYYTIHITNSASATYTLPAKIGPNLATGGGATNLQPSPSICTAAQNTAANNGTASPADDVVVQMIGFDYPAYQAALGLTQPATPEKPVITGANGQADVTISQAAEQDAGSSVQRPLTHRVMHAFNARRARR